MIVEYIKEGHVDCPLIRIYGNDLRDFVEFREVTRFLGEESGRSMNLTSRPGISAKNISDIHMTSSDRNCLTITGDAVEWSLNRSEWHLLSLLTQGLIDLPEHIAGHQWLAGPNASPPLDFGEISVVLSKSELGIW